MDEQEYQQPYKSKMITFGTPPFFERVCCFYGTRDELEAATEELFEDTQEWLNTVRVPDYVGGFCLPMVDKDGSYQFIWINAEIGEQTDSAVWHESLHATINILCSAGCHINMHEQEMATYMQGYIAQGILDNLVDETEQQEKTEQKKSAKIAKKRSRTRSDAAEEEKTLKRARARLIAHVELYREQGVK